MDSQTFKVTISDGWYNLFQVFFTQNAFLISHCQAELFDFDH